MSVLLSAAVDRWIAVRLASNWCPKTGQNAKGIWHQAIARFGDRDLRTISSWNVEDLFLRIRECSPGWTNYCRSKVRGFFHWALQHGMIRRDPAVDSWPLLPDTAEPIFRTVDRQEETGLCHRLPPALCRYVILAIATGLRCSTLYRLIWAWVTQDWILAIPGCAVKNRRPIRIPLTAKAIEAIGPRCADGERILRGLPHPTNLNRILQRYAAQAGLDPRHLTTHQFRRTWVERFRDAGGTAEECMLIQGWSSANVLIQHYWPRCSDQRAREILEQI